VERARFCCHSSPAVEYHALRSAGSEYEVHFSTTIDQWSRRHFQPEVRRTNPYDLAIYVNDLVVSTWIILSILEKIGIDYFNRAFSTRPVHLMCSMSTRRKLYYRHRKRSDSDARCYDVLLQRGWHRVTLPLPIPVLQQDYARFRISTASSTMSAYGTDDSWAIDNGNSSKLYERNVNLISVAFIGRCFRGCSGHGWCQLNSCR
jgi:hypothetical protein